MRRTYELPPSPQPQLLTSLPCTQGHSGHFPLPNSSAKQPTLEAASSTPIKPSTTQLDLPRRAYSRRKSGPRVAGFTFNPRPARSQENNQMELSRRASDPQRHQEATRIIRWNWAGKQLIHRRHFRKRLHASSPITDGLRAPRMEALIVRHPSSSLMHPPTKNANARPPPRTRTLQKPSTECHQPQGSNSLARHAAS